jgi:glucose/arabinose dehydrogenase
MQLDVPSLLSYIYQPLQPLVRRLHLTRRGPRRYEPRDILLPPGYVAELVATGFTAPVHCTFDDAGAAYVTEAGHKSESVPRIWRVDPATGAKALFFELPADRWLPTGAVTGAAWLNGALYVSNTDTISRIGPDGELTDVVTELPGRGDHQTNHPVSGPDGKLYWGQGSATNLGVVGADNFGYEWLPKFPHVCDVPAADVVLTGRNYPFRDVLGGLTKSVESGAFLPFGTPSSPGQVILGNPKCTGAILRCNPDGSDLQVVAWGLRNPYGIAFAPDGRLFATEHGSDERGARFIIGDPDDFYEIREGAWYGWPDFASGVRLDDSRWGRGGQGREPVLAEFPDASPPVPLASFPTHAAANGFDFSRSAAFGFEGQAFVALFGDLAPITTPRQVVPEGFAVARVDTATGEVTPFAVNRRAGPASKLFHGGFERPSHCAFGPDGALYVTDWGEIKIAVEKGGIRMQQETGALWRVRRTDGPAGTRAPEPQRVPFYPIQAAVVAAGALGAIVALVTLVRRILRRR